MRTPLWLPLYPPPPSETEDFKLPRAPSRLGAMAFETPAQRDRRLRCVRREAYRFFSAVGRHLGDDETNKLFDGFTSKPVRRGAPSGPKDQERDRELLAIYDAFAAKNAMASPAAVAQWLFKKPDRGTRFGSSPDAVERHIRRLLHQRNRRRALEEARWRRRIANRPKSEPSFLSETLAIETDTNSEN